MGATFDLGRVYNFHPGVSLRRESFGALAYDYNTRRLLFIRSSLLVDLLEHMSGGVAPSEAFAHLDVDGRARAGLERALGHLEASGLFAAPNDDAAADAPGPKRARVAAPQPGTSPNRALAATLENGAQAPICLTWEITYACNLACIHCLSSSGRRDPRELSTAEAKAVIDELAAMKVFYINVGGGEPLTRRDFFDLLDYSVSNGVGVKFSTNGLLLDKAKARRLADMDYVDVQISLDGATAETNDAVRGTGSHRGALRAMDNLAEAGFGAFKISVVATRHNVGQLDDLEALAERYGAQLRITRLRPSGRGAETWRTLHPTAEQQKELYHWLVERPQVLTGDSFFHLSALGEPLPGLNLCGAGRVVCLIDPIGDVYACPFVLHTDFRAGSVRDPGGLAQVWSGSDLFASLRSPQSAGACASCGAYDACRGGCMAAKFFTGLPLEGPDPECVLGHGEVALLGAPQQAPSPTPDHSKASRGAFVPVELVRIARTRPGTTTVTIPAFPPSSSR